MQIDWHSETLGNLHKVSQSVNVLGLWRWVKGIRFKLRSGAIKVHGIHSVPCPTAILETTITQKKEHLGFCGHTQALRKLLLDCSASVTQWLSVVLYGGICPSTRCWRYLFRGKVVSSPLIHPCYLKLSPDDIPCWGSSEGQSYSASHIRLWDSMIPER